MDPNEQQGGQETPTLPDFIHEKFKSTENPVEAQARAYPELAAMIGRREDQIAESLRPKLMEEVAASLKKEAGVPDTFDGYQLPQDWNRDNPVAKQVLEGFHKAGLGQKQLEAVLDVYKSLAPDLKAEREKLGEDAEQRIEQADAWLRSVSPEDLLNDAKGLTMTANGVRLVEEIMKKVGTTMPNTEDSGGRDEGPMTIKKLSSMMDDPRYSDPTKRDPNYVKLVNDLAATVDEGPGPG